MKKKDYPSYPKNNNPIEFRIRGGFKTPSQWAKLAKIAEENNEFGDAYYFWLASSNAYTRSSKKQKIYSKRSLECLEKWRKNYD